MVRVLAVVLLVLFLSTNMFRSKSIDTMDDEWKCFRDTTFIWTQPVNDYMATNKWEFTRYFVIISSFGMDFMTVMGILLFNKSW
jgi:hypothetical protein